jgi:hypothetical protein
MGSVPPYGIHGHMDRTRRRKRRHLDVQRRIRVADDQPRSRSADRLVGSGCNHAADIPAGDSGGSAGGYRRQAAIPPGDGGSGNRGLCAIRHVRLARPGHAAHIVAVRLPDRCRGSFERSRLAGDRAAACSEGGPRTCRFGEQRRFQHQPCHRSGAWRSDYCRFRHRRALLAQRHQQSGSGGCSVVVASLANPRSASARRRHQQCHRGRGSLCQAQPAPAGHDDTRGRFFPRRKRLLGTASARCASTNCGGPELYGILLGAIGTGAVLGAFGLPWLKSKLGPNRLVAAGTLGTAIALLLFGLARDTLTGLLASLIAGAAWICVLASLNVSAQVALPEWVRGRGLAAYMTIFFGALTLGSVIWGKLASLIGLETTHFVAAAAAAAVIALTWRWKLQTGAGLDLTPSMHWPAPITTREIEHDRGPVLVTVEYRIDPKGRNAFLACMDELARERRRDGAYRWRVFEDAAEEGRFVETFLVASWLEHLRQHERVTNADHLLQDAIARFHMAGTPKVTHLIAAEPDPSP